MYIRSLTQLVEELQGVFLSGIQVGDARQFAIPNPRFKGFPILYNPKIIEQYDLIRSEAEGCLSFPGLWIKVPRFRFVVIQYRDSNWKEIEATFGSEDPNSEEGLAAKAIQHEIFHMQGIVLVDRIKDFKTRIKTQALILDMSRKQNLAEGVPSLIDGPAELNPEELIRKKPNHDSVIGGTALDPTVPNPSGPDDTTRVVSSDGLTK
jgi:peptide deformylase